jgi:two-component system, OmpR family, sensor histidine kinase ChvG
VKVAIWPPWPFLRRASSRIAVRMLAFNVLLVFLPLAGLLYLDTYEQHLLDAQERSMVQQGRVLAAALADRDPLDAESIDRLLRPLGQRVDARLRILDATGRVLGDTSRTGDQSEPIEGGASSDREYVDHSATTSTPGAASASRENFLYRLGSLLALTARRVRRDLTELVLGGRTTGTVQPPLAPGQIAQPASWPEVQAALAGRYGSATRLTRGGQRSVTLYSALPIRSGGPGSAGSPGSSGERVTGVVLVSQSTYRVLQAIYDVRLRIFEVVIGSLFVAAILTFVVAATIARPIRRLRRDAAELLDHRGRLTRRFQASARRDEIGDLGRALDELTRRLDEHLRFVEAFSADVSHEFKNPLASIRTITEMLTSVDDPAERERFLGMMRRDVDRLERLLSGVREIATIDAQLERETTTDVDVRVIVTNVADAHRLRSRGRVTIAIDSSTSTSSSTSASASASATTAAPTLVRAAPERLAQIFDNLVDNAIGFSPDGGTVKIDISRIDGDCRVRIRDEGPGIPDSHLTRVFERFFTYRPGTPDSRRHHTGLGLAIAKAIVESYGGTIAAIQRDDRDRTSTGGACLVVRLPLIGSSGPPAQRPRSATVVASRNLT